MIIICGVCYGWVLTIYMHIYTTEWWHLMKVVEEDACASFSHSWCLLLWPESLELHEGRASQHEHQKGWPQAFHRSLQTQLSDALWGRQGSPTLAGEDRDKVQEGLDARRRDTGECEPWFFRTGPDTWEKENHTLITLSCIQLLNSTRCYILRRKIIL